MPSLNFQFLSRFDPQLAHLAERAELYVHDDPNTALLKLRQFAELLAQQASARLGIETGPEVEQFRLLRDLESRGALNRQLAEIFHLVRKTGNQASHAFDGTIADAIRILKMSRQLALWFQRSFGSDRSFRAGAFVPPQPPGDRRKTLLARLAATETELEAVKQETAEAAERAEIEAELRRSAEVRAQMAETDAEVALDLAAESERQHEELLSRLAEQRSVAQVTEIAQSMTTAPASEIDLAVGQAAQAGDLVELDEAATRKLIDQQLRDAGWQADSQNLTHGRGARPIKNQDRAIAEWPTARGPADYVLFRGLVPLAVVEAKRERKNVQGAIEQAKRYSRSFAVDGEQLAGGPSELGGPWGEYRIPFLYATNGKPFLRQLLEQSGIWALDARRPTNHPYALEGWPSPEGLYARLQQDIEAADRALAETSSDYLPLRNYQHDAVRAVERHIAAGQREILVAMATGTGKTRTCIGLCYRLLKAGRFRRILFLVDRSALGIQAHDAFQDVRLENQQAFTDIYDTKQLGDLAPDADTRLQVATIQGMVRRQLYSHEEGEALPIDTYDCIVVDECHRGYALDRELSDSEITFRSEAEYISKYRRVLDHFDAVKIGLTATPALHTTDIFGPPVFEYSYRQAVIDHYLVDHEPPHRLITALAESGIHWTQGDEIDVYDTGRGQIELFRTPDEIDLEVEDFNKAVLTENFNRVVCQELARNIDPTLPGKTLVYCVNDLHADRVVTELKKAFAEQYGEIDDDAVQKITGAADKPLEKIRYYKNERHPSVAVTVDLLTTGIDVPEITNLVFLRRVKSRILYEQMLGRATRLCPGLFEGYAENPDKEVFQIYDAVDLYSSLQHHTAMKPVVQNPNITFEQLLQELAQVSDPAIRSDIQDQLITKLQRKRKVFEARLPEDFEAAAGLDPESLVEQLRLMTPDQVIEYFSEHGELVPLLDRKLPSLGQKILISHDPDEILRVERGYGEAKKPEDFLDSFGRYIRENLNDIAALKIVTTRPRELTRKQLRELKLELDRAGFSEINLRTAYRETTNQDIAASILGYIRQQTLREPLVPYDQRVSAALDKILQSRTWSPIQRQWLTRIGKQLVKETIVDRDALNQGQFGAQGGFQRLDKIFDGRIEQVLGELQDEVWSESA